MEKIRTFIAIKLAGEVICKLKDAQDVLKKEEIKAKWVEPENIHLTLKFLGDTPVEKLEDIKRTLENIASGFKPFDISLDEIGAFPGRKRPRIIWVGVQQGKDQLIELASVIENSFESLGFSKEERKFSAHISLARVKSLGSPAGFFDVSEKIRRDGFGRMSVERVSLIKSTLAKSGPIYEIIYEAILDKAE